jgi:hypothetical protein
MHLLMSSLTFDFVKSQKQILKSSFLNYRFTFAQRISAGITYELNEALNIITI